MLVPPLPLTHALKNVTVGDRYAFGFFFCARYESIDALVAPVQPCMLYRAKKLLMTPMYTTKRNRPAQAEPSVV